MLHVLFLLFAALPPCRANDYYGEFIGDFKNRLQKTKTVLTLAQLLARFHGVTGEVYAVDSRTIYIKGFRCASLILRLIKPIFVPVTTERGRMPTSTSGNVGNPRGTEYTSPTTREPSRSSALIGTRTLC